jgi:hypothetical protein
MNLPHFGTQSNIACLIMPQFFSCLQGCLTRLAQDRSNCYTHSLTRALCNFPNPHSKTFFIKEYRAVHRSEMARTISVNISIHIRAEAFRRKCSLSHQKTTNFCLVGQLEIDTLNPHCTVTSSNMTQGLITHSINPASDTRPDGSQLSGLSLLGPLFTQAILHPSLKGIMSHKS